MPECWAKDRARRKKAGIPRSLRFATKPELAIAQVKTMIEKGIRICWVAADEVYGRSGGFRAACRAAFLSYVVIIPCDSKVTLAKGTAPVRADKAAKDAVFEKRSAGNGTKATALRWWALLATEDPEEFLLVRRLEREKNPYTYYLCHAAPGRPATLKYFVTVAGRRWPAETSFRARRTASAGTSPRSPPGLAQNRHTLLAALAMIRVIFLRRFLTRENEEVKGSAAPEGTEPPPSRSRNQPPAPQEHILTCAFTPAPTPCPPSPGCRALRIIPPVCLSDTETARIDALTRAYTGGLLSRDRLAFHFRWSHWRRRHQARAR